MKRIFVKSQGEWSPLIFEEILWITKSKSKKNYVAVQTTHQLFESKFSLTAMQILLPNSEFIRVHSSYIIRLDKITEVESGFAHVKLGLKRIPVGDSFVQTLQEHCSFIK
ncbi:LytTR family DNA-binding domain-containing protein [Fluviicola taffensis]|uniref:LytR/AlgR family response regulator transcription factor n=1 Tax=Fluviicola taffensis TaxID=191579 RepID=UPI003137A13C